MNIMRRFIENYNEIIETNLNGLGYPNHLCGLSVKSRSWCRLEIWVTRLRRKRICCFFPRVRLFDDLNLRSDPEIGAKNPLRPPKCCEKLPRSRWFIIALKINWLKQYRGEEERARTRTDPPQKSCSPVGFLWETIPTSLLAWGRLEKRRLLRIRQFTSPNVASSAEQPAKMSSNWQLIGDIEVVLLQAISIRSGVAFTTAGLFSLRPAWRHPCLPTLRALSTQNLNESIDNIGFVSSTESCTIVA